MARTEGRIRLVVDTNILFAAIINSKGNTAKAIFSPNLELYAPEFIRLELEKYRALLMQKGRYKTMEFLDDALGYLLERIAIVPKELYVDVLNRAMEITPDPKDTEFVALSIKLNCPLWTLDKALLEAPEIPTITTKEILEKLR